jgi:hypothetical protein
MEAAPETKVEEVDLPFSFDTFSSGVAFLRLPLMRLTAQNIITLGKIIIASSIGYEVLTITSEISTL